MTPAGRIAAIIACLDEIIAAPRPADAVISAYFRARRYIGSKDRSAVASQIYLILRHFLQLSWHLEQAHARRDGRNLVLAQLLLIEHWPLEEIQENFTGEHYAPHKVTRDEQLFLNQLLHCHPRENGDPWIPASAGMTGLECNEMPIHIQVECPAKYAEKFQATFGDNFAAEMRGMLTEAPLDLRVNPRVATRAAAIAELKAAKVDAAPTPYSPFGIRIHGRPALPTLDLYKRGGVEIQDEGSQLIALLMGAQPGEHIVDFCAGAGGKTLAIAAMMENKGRVIACDVLDRRLEKSRTRFTRAGLENIQIRPLTSENDKWVKRSAGQFDRVLVDAPCSGTGVWRRNPDARWKQLGPGLAELLPLQARILSSAARLVKPGGRLVYATCSLLPDENQLQVEKFLAEHSDFKLLPAQQACTPDMHLPDTGDYMNLSPARHGTDGFFAAVMERRK